MPDRIASHEDYVRRVKDEALQCARDLLEENERLKGQIAFLESERSHLRRRLTAAEKAADLASRLKTSLETLESEKAQLEGRVAMLSLEADDLCLEHGALQERLRLAAQHREVRGHEYEKVARRSASLANLYVASFRLHETLDREAVLEAIQEIVVNLVGSEEFAVFEIDEATGEPALEAGVGLDTTSWNGLSLAKGPVGRALRTGEIFVAEDTNPDRGALACIPLKVAGEVAGAVVVFRLLAHKPGFEPIDRELFELLAAQAGTALYSARLHSRAAAAGNSAEARRRAAFARQPPPHSGGESAADTHRHETGETR